MAAQRKLNNAPITEALIDFRVSLPQDVLVEDLLSFTADQMTAYPLRQPRYQFKSEFQSPPDGVPSVKNDAPIHDGYFLTTERKTRIVQFRLDGFTSSHVTPYKDWETLRDETKRLWSIFCRVARPISVDRVAIRYINKIDLPMPIGDFGDYLKIQPQVPKPLPDTVGSFLLRTMTPISDPQGTTVAFTQSCNKPENNKLPVIVDIDIFAYETFEPTSSFIWDTLEKFRVLKNALFFDNLEEKALEPYK